MTITKTKITHRMILLKLEKLIEDELNIKIIWNKLESIKFYKSVFELPNISKLSKEFLEKFETCFLNYNKKLTFEKIENSIRVTIDFEI